MNILAVAFLFSVASFAHGAERVQKFGGIEVTQVSDPVCVGLRIKYEGKFSQEKRLQAYVNLNGASGIFAMERDSESHKISLTSCPVSCQDDRPVQRQCTDRPVEMRKVFYWATQNGKLTPWFLELAFLGEAGGDDLHHDNYNFYFP